MKPLDIKIALAQIAGWRWTSQEVWVSGGGHYVLKPGEIFSDYLPESNDSVDNIEKKMHPYQKMQYLNYLGISPDYYKCELGDEHILATIGDAVTANKQTRAEALLRMFGKWKE